MTRLIRLAAAAVGTGLVLTGCSGQPGGAPATPRSSAVASTAPSGGEFVGEAVLGDGRHPVFLKTIDLAERTITFDLIEFYSGADAEKKWREDHPTETELAALDGYYIRNNNPKLRTLPLADGARAKVLDPSGGVEPVTVPLAEVTGPFVGRPFWLTVFEGRITLLEEQFIP